MKHTSMFRIVITLSLTTACGYVGHNSNEVIHKNNVPITNSGTSPETKPDGFTLSFDNIKTHILEPKCFKCHSNSAFFKSADEMRNRKSDISDRLFDDPVTPMPPKKAVQLTQCEQDILRKFLDLGVPSDTDKTVSDIPTCKSADQ